MRTKQAYINYKEEGEKFFVTRFIDTNNVRVFSMVKTIMKALDIILNLSRKPAPKGLCLFSKAFGQGKTMFFDIVYHRANRVKNVKLFKKITAKELRRMYMEQGSQALEDFISCKDLFIDDIGEEEGKGTHYGDGLEVIRHVILRRYEMWTEKGYRFHFTTNIIGLDETGRPDFSEIVKRYDGRVADRLKEMCDFVEFEFLKGGASFRQVKSTRRLSKEEKANPETKAVPEVDLNKLDKEYLNYCEVLAEEHRKGVLQEHWHVFKVMYGYLENKGVTFRKENQEDKEKALAVMRSDNRLGRGILSRPNTEVLTKKDGNMQNAVKALICKEYFIKLAESNFKFSEAETFPQL
jgi:hypothetical protein